MSWTLVRLNKCVDCQAPFIVMADIPNVQHCASCLQARVDYAQQRMREANKKSKARKKRSRRKP
jgi:hypothetical protein